MSVVPALIDALVQKAAAALPAVLVSDGFTLTEDPGDFMMIGVEDPDNEGFETSADSQQEWAHANHTARNQTGDITCAALSWNGNSDQKAARDAAYRLTSALATLLRNDPSLGLVPGSASMLVASFGTREQLIQTKDEKGALSLVVFTVHFQARI